MPIIMTHMEKDFRTAITKIKEKENLNENDWRAIASVNSVFAAYHIAQIMGKTPLYGLDYHNRLIRKIIDCKENDVKTKPQGYSESTNDLKTNLQGYSVITNDIKTQ